MLESIEISTKPNWKKMNKLGFENTIPFDTITPTV